VRYEDAATIQVMMMSMSMMMSMNVSMMMMDDDVDNDEDDDGDDDDDDDDRNDSTLQYNIIIITSSYPHNDHHHIIPTLSASPHHTHTISITSYPAYTSIVNFLDALNERDAMYTLINYVDAHEYALKVRCHRRRSFFLHHVTVALCITEN